MDAWIVDELNGCGLGDRRLDQRLNKLLEDLSQRMGQGIPLASQDWAATKAAYRFLDNTKVTEAAILEGHFQATKARFAATEVLTLVLHDTTEFSYQREHREAIGQTHLITAGRASDGRRRQHTVRGLLMHSSLVVTTEGLPLRRRPLGRLPFADPRPVAGHHGLVARLHPTHGHPPRIRHRG